MGIPSGQPGADRQHLLGLPRRSEGRGAGYPNSHGAPDLRRGLPTGGPDGHPCPGGGERHIHRGPAEPDPRAGPERPVLLGLRVRGEQRGRSQLHVGYPVPGQGRGLRQPGFGPAALKRTASAPPRRR